MDPLAEASTLVANSIKVANAYKERLDKVKPADPALIEKAASALLGGGWVPASRKDDLMAMLADSNQALPLLTELATKAAEALEQQRTNQGNDPRLASGTPIPGKKEASAPAERVWVGDRPESEADRAFANRMAALRAQMATGTIQ